VLTSIASIDSGVVSRTSGRSRRTRCRADAVTSPCHTATVRPSQAAYVARRRGQVVRDSVHVEWLRIQGMVRLARVDLDVNNTLAPQATRLGDALTALAAAALTPAGPGLPARLTVDANRPDHLWPARRVSGASPAGLRFPLCRVLTRP
jgi:hypothetical protein